MSSYVVLPSEKVRELCSQRLIKDISRLEAEVAKWKKAARDMSWWQQFMNGPRERLEWAEMDLRFYRSSGMRRINALSDAAYLVAEVSVTVDDLEAIS